MASEFGSFELASDIEGHQDLFGKVFNSGDADAVNAMYTEDAIGVWDPGKPLTGQARKDRVAEFLSRGPTVDATVRQSFVTKDIAMLIVDWTIDTTSVEGEPEHLEGAAVDVLRRGEDGKWRYVVDSPYAINNPYGQDV